MTWGDKACPEQASSAAETRCRRGGEIVAEGTPEHVAEEKRSYTGSYLKALLKGERATSKELALDEAAAE